MKQPKLVSGKRGSDFLADYKRMVSYMYQYENGVKKKNVGFARVEAKNGQCKITLHMQLLGQLDSIFPTYLIQRDENDMELIYLGDTVLKNQVMDSKLSAAEANIMDSGFGLTAMGGLLLFLNDKVFFATEWDDKPIVAREVLAALKPKSKKVINPIEEDPLTVAENLIKATHQQKDETPLYTAEEELLLPKYKLPRGWKTLERLQKPQTTSVSEPARLIYESEPEVSLADNETLKETDNIDIASIKQGEPIPENLIMDSDTTEDSIESTEYAEAEVADHPSAMNFFNNYPRIYPFEDNEVTLCVKIEPKDIGSLPKDIWALSNNSFLMHGFYCYHHLIFAKMKDRFGCRYVLGVPGIFHNREQFMARMFGFDNFKSIRKRELRQGDFGYWYLPITF
jgi:hypothetical protein